MMQDLWAGEREQIKQAVFQCIDDDRFKSGQLVREQLEASEPADYQTAALACVAASRAVGGSDEAALPGAVAIAYLSQMALVFMGLENSGGRASLSTAWGMPRSLNAGDAMFALAQESLLSVPDELTDEVRLHAAHILDEGTRALVEELFASDGDVVTLGQRALLPTAMALGGLLGGGDDARLERLAGLGHDWASLPDDELARMLASEPNNWL
jgi:hypothetical protein